MLPMVVVSGHIVFRGILKALHNAFLGLLQNGVGNVRIPFGVGVHARSVCGAFLKLFIINFTVLKLYGIRK